MLINSALDGRHACIIAFVPSGAAGGSVFLVDDAGDAAGPYSGMVLPGSGTVQNSQCSVSGTGSMVQGSGNTLTLTLVVTFSASFAGNRIFYLLAQDKSGGNSGAHEQPGPDNIHLYLYRYERLAGYQRVQCAHQRRESTGGTRAM